MKNNNRNMEVKVNEKHHAVSIIAFILLLIFFTPGFSHIYAEENMIYGHISYMDKETYVLKSGEDRALKAKVNLPLIPGDIIYTESGGRCEIQFDNGSMMRLDKNTELKLDTMLAKSLTSNDKITTLQLKKGSLFSMNQVYNNEVFQVITPTAAIKMINRSTNYIKVLENGETRGFIEKGKIGVLYSSDKNSSSKEYVGAGKGFLVTKDYTFKISAWEKDMEFTAWNDYINRKFKELHYGTSKVPAVIYRSSPGIVHFAEKWSTRFGVWEYNDLFGYVWKPYDDIFQGNRPFLDADYVRVNGELVLVPDQPWGWAPAHLGTWFFSKTYGWVWIPGDAFSPGICSVGLLPLEFVGVFDQFGWFSLRNYAFGSLGHWIYTIFGDSQLYYIYRIGGSKAWRTAYSQKYQHEALTSKPSLSGVPQNIKTIINKMNKAPLEKIEKHFTSNSPATDFKFDRAKMIKSLSFDRSKSLLLKSKPLNVKKIDTQKTNEFTAHKSFDWNPDIRWAGKVGVEIFYSSKENAVICPQMNISSKYVNDLDRSILRRGVVDRNLLNISFGDFRGGTGAVPGSNNGYFLSGKNRNPGSEKTTGSGSSGSAGTAKK